MNGCRNLYSYLICVVALILLSGLSWTCSNPVVIKYFNASPTVITVGQSATLQWDVAGATRVNINNGVGTVAASGKAVVTPQVATTYLLTVPNDTQRLAVTIEVRPAPDASQPEKSQATGPNTESKQAVNSPSATSMLRYDNLDNSTEGYLSNQIAVWHTYARLPNSPGTAQAGYAGDVHRTFTSSSITGIPVNSPLIILPSREGMVCVVKNYANLSHQYLKIGTTWYNDTADESDRLGQPGWGLMTTFSPATAPFKVQRINIAAAANHSGPPEDYDKYLFAVRILDENGNRVWSKLLPWSLFRSDTSAGNPKASWKSIEVPNVAVNGDFSVEVLTESNECLVGKHPSYHYLALAYEVIKSKDVSTRSSISEAGSKADAWIRLYDSYGQPSAFNLCVRVEGNYPAR